MASKIKQFALNAGSGWAAQLSFAIVGLILMPYIIIRVGESGYGIFQLARSGLLFFMFLQLGMGPTLVRFFAQSIAKNDTEELRRINSTAQLLLGGLGMLACLSCLALIPVFINFYQIPAELVKETNHLLICMILSLFLSMTSIVPQGLVFGVNRYDLANYFEIANHLIMLAVVVALFEYIRPSIFFVGIAILSGQLFRYAALFSVAIKYTGKAALFSIQRINRKSMQAVLGFSMLNLANSVAATVAFQGPVLIIGKVMGEEMVTAFAPALLISSAMQGFLGKTTRPLVPLASQDRELNRGLSLGNWAISGGQLAAFVGFGITLPLIVFGHEIMGLWLGENLSWIWPIVAVMSTGVAISQVQAANYFLALGGGQINPTVYSQIVMAVVVFTGTLLGTVWFGWNLLAVAFYIGLCIFIRNTFYLAYAYSRQFSYDYVHYLWRVYGIPLFITFTCAGFGWFMKVVLPPQNIIVLITEGIIVLGLYIIFCWIFLLPRLVKEKMTAFGLAKIKRISISPSPS